MEEQKTTNIPEQNEIQSQSSESADISTPNQEVSEPKEEKLFNPMFIFIVVAVLIVGAGFYYFMTDRPSTIMDDTKTTAIGVAASDYPEVVAVVNGEELGNKEFAMSINQAEQVALQQGADVNDPAVKSEIEAQALTVLVNTELLIQAATGAGFSASDEEIDAEIAQIASQYGGEEAFAAAVAQLGLTTEKLRSDVRNQIIVDAYLEGSEEFGDLAVTETEVQEAYDSFAAEGSGLPPLEEIYEPLKQQLLSQKQQIAVGELIGRLRSEAEIEELI